MIKNTVGNREEENPNDEYPLADSRTWNKRTDAKRITNTYISGHNSCTLVIPKSIATECGLDSPSHVVVERTKDGILIRKLEI